jgi:hypothetical protein
MSLAFLSISSTGMDRMILSSTYGSMLDVKYLEEGVLKQRLADIMARTPNSDSPCTDSPMRAKCQEVYEQERKDVKKFLTL